GATTWAKVRRLPAPSRAAASSSSSGIDRKKPASRKIVNGRFRATYTTTRPNSEFSSPRRCTMVNSGMTITWVGTPTPTAMYISATLDSRRFVLARMSPAGAEMTTMPTAAVTQTSTELLMAAPNPELTQAFTQFSVCSVRGSPHGLAKISAWLRMELTNTQMKTARLKAITSQTAAEATLRQVLLRREDRRRAAMLTAAPPLVGSTGAAAPRAR